MRFVIVVTVLAFPVFVHAATIYVPTDQPTIQAGIDAAVNGDTVLVAPGTYVENIDFLLSMAQGVSVPRFQGA